MGIREQYEDQTGLSHKIISDKIIGIFPTWGYVKWLEARASTPLTQAQQATGQSAPCEYCKNESDLNSKMSLKWEYCPMCGRKLWV